MKRNNRWEIFFVALSTIVMVSLYFLVVPFLEFVELWDLHFKQRGVLKPFGLKSSDGAFARKIACRL